MQNLDSDIASLKTEVKYLKWIIPAACSFICILVLIFWGIERKNVGERVKKALAQKGIKTALEEVNSIKSDVVLANNKIQTLLNDNKVKVQELSDILTKTENVKPICKIEMWYSGVHNKNCEDGLGKNWVTAGYFKVKGGVEFCEPDNECTANESKALVCYMYCEYQ